MNYNRTNNKSITSGDGFQHVRSPHRALVGGRQSVPEMPTVTSPIFGQPHFNLQQNSSKDAKSPHIASGGLAARRLYTNGGSQLAVLSSSSVGEKSIETSNGKSPNVLAGILHDRLNCKRKHSAISELDSCEIHKLSDLSGSMTFDDCFHSRASLTDFLDAEASTEHVEAPEEKIEAPEAELDWELLSFLPFHETAIVP